jgi:hypothetical protein
MCFDLIRLWRCLSLPAHELAAEIADAMRAARDPRTAEQDCPWGPSIDPEIGLRRIAWRVGFRLYRERSGESPIARGGRAAA